GWNYTIPLQMISEQPDMSIPDWGKVWIDDYMDNPYHDPNKKTLALIDINKIEELEEALSQVARFLNLSITDQKTYNGVGVSISKTERYGYDPQLNQERTIDLSDLTTHLEEAIVEGTPYFSVLRSSIADAVIYQRNDGSRPDSWGVSIFSPRTKPLQDFVRVSESAPINKDWDEFMRQYMTFISQDKGKPVITDLGGGRYQVTDDQGLAYVRIDTDWLPEITNWSHSYGLKSEPVYPTELGLYIPNPDDQTFYLKDTGSGEKVPFFHSFIGTDSEGKENYFGYVQVNRNGRTKNAVINPVRNPESGEITYALYPYDIREDGQQFFSKVPLSLKPGDIVIPKIVERFLDPNNPRWQFSLYTPLIVTGSVEIVRDSLPYGSYFSTLTTSDYNSNFGMAIIGNIRFLNNSSLSSITAP
ncbi:MAG: clostripain-related cysteine peptidase, partial [Methanobacteriota archaeon]